MSTSQNGSRLGQMKARFQQKQLQEKEEKLTKLYENQQQRTLERVVKTRSNIHSQYSTSKSIGSSGETSPATISSGNSSIGSQIGRGRVRQLFEERRQNKIAGIDKSYPLEPIKGTKSSIIKNDKKTTTTTRVNSFNHTTNTKQQIMVNSSISTQKKQHSIVNNNIDTSDTVEENRNDIEKVVNEHHNIEQMMNKHNLFESLDDENFPDVELIDDDLDSTFGKLPNIGRTLPSEKLTTINNNKITATKLTNGKLKSINQPTLLSENKINVENNSRKNESFKRKTNTLGDGDASKTITRTVVKKTETKQPVTNKSFNRKPETNSESQKSKTPSSHENTTNSKSTIEANRVKSSPRQNSGTISRNSSEKKRINTNNKASPVANDNLRCCKYCNRRFAEDRIDKHETICAKTTNKKRKPYDATKHRVLGTEAESYIKKGVRSKPQPQAVKKKNWRQAHEEFIQAIRAAKQVQQFVASGGNLKDLPPPPPSTNPDYVQCPHCGRKFNEAAANRHIPKCANYSFNKPKPDNKNIKRR